jgi:hypothetical protein
MKTSRSNELLSSSDPKATSHSNHHHKAQLTSSDIDTLKLKEIEDLKFERIKKKSEKQMLLPGNNNNNNRFQAQKGNGSSNDADDYIDLKDCYSKKGQYIILLLLNDANYSK